MSGSPFDWHIFAVEWTPTGLKFMVDDVVVSSYAGEAVPFGPEFIIFSLGMGGGWIGTPDSGKMPAEMLVDYVRVYQKEDYTEENDGLPDGVYTIKSEYSGPAKRGARTLYLSPTRENIAGGFAPAFPPLRWG